MDKQILIIADDHALRQRYAEVLTATTPLDNESYQVVTVSILTNAAWYAARRYFDLVMIDSQLGGPRAALTWLLVDRNPQVQVITIGAPGDRAPRDPRQRSSFSMVAADCTAAELRAVVRSLLSLPPRMAVQA